MTLTFLYGLGAVIVLIFVAVIMWRFMLERMDGRNEVEFKSEIYPKISKSPIASAHYHGLRLIAVAIIIAAIVGRFI